MPYPFAKSIAYLAAAALPALPALGAGTAAGTAGSLPAVELNAKLLYMILSSDIAAQRGELSAAFSTWLSLARQTGDPRFAQSASELALRMATPKNALYATDLWQTLDPDDREAQLSRLEALVLAGRSKDALALVPRIAKLPGDSGETMLDLEDILAQLPDRQAAYDALAGCASSIKGSAKAELALARAALSAKLTDQARKHAEQALQLDPKMQGASMTLAASYPVKDWKKACGILRKRLEQSYSGQVHAELIRTLAAAGQKDLLPQEISAAATKPGILPSDLLKISTIAAAVNLPDQAIAALKRVIDSPEAIGHEVDRAQMLLGKLYARQNKWDKAADCYGRVGPGPLSGDAKVEQILAIASGGNLQRALAEARGQNPADHRLRATFRLVEALILKDMGRKAESLTAVESSLRIVPDNTRALFEAGVLCEELQRYAAMEKYMRRVIELEPNNYQALNTLGYSLADRGVRLKEALGLLEKAVKAAPGDHFIEDSMGWVLYRLGRLEEARQWLSKALKGMPKEDDIAAHLIVVLTRMHRKAEAKALYKERRSSVVRKILSAEKVSP